MNGRPSLAAPPRAATNELALGAAIVFLLLDALRRYTATSAIALVGVLSPYPVALLVVLPFVLQAPAVSALSRRPPRRALVVVYVVLVLTALTAPLASDTTLVIALAGAGCFAGAIALAMVVSARPHGVAPAGADAVALGIVVDVAIRIGRGTLDLAELPAGGGPLLVGVEAVLCFAIGALALRRERAWSPPSIGAAGIFAIPLALAIAELAGTNGWQAAAAAGFGLVDDGGLRATGVGTVAIALGLAAGSLIAGRPARVVAASSLVGGAAIAAMRIPTLSLAGGALLACGLVLSLRLLRSEGSRLTPARTSAILTGGWIANFAVVLAYYVPYAVAPVLWAGTALLAALVLATRGHSGPAPVLRAATAIAIVVALVMTVSASTARPLAATGTLRVMTYNIHFGFDPDQTPSLDAIAETIERESPDIVVLQEVMRGGSLAVQHDTLGWLAARLGMTYVFAPTVGDFFGNALLTRLAIDGHERLSFTRPAPLRHSPRGALLVHVAGIAIIVTHLDEYVDAGGDAVREDEIRTLLTRWGGTPPPLVIAGDLNAVPHSRAIELLTAAGFRDLAADAGATIPARAPKDRIDYVMAKGIVASAARVVSSSASDHRPVVVDLMVTSR